LEKRLQCLGQKYGNRNEARSAPKWIEQAKKIIEWNILFDYYNRFDYAMIESS